MSSKKKQSSHIFDILQSEFGTPDYGLRQFRKDVAKLKKLGLVSKKTDARKQQPTRYMRSLVRSFADVLKGEAKAFSVPKKEAPIYKGAGHRVKGHKVVVPTPHGEKVRRAKTVEGVPSYVTEARGVRREHHVFPQDNLRAKLIARVEKLKPLKKGEYYAFRFKGYMSYRYFSGAEAKRQMINYLESYLPEELSETEADDYLMEFEFVTITDTGAWLEGVRQQKEASKARNRERNNARHNEWRRRKYAAMDALERKEKNEKSAQAKQHDKNYHKQKREELKRTNPEAYRAMLEKNAARMRKSRANRKK
jgi:hypothetical protein